MKTTARLESRDLSLFVAIIDWTNGAKWKSAKYDTVEKARLAASLVARDLGIKLEWEV